MNAGKTQDHAGSAEGFGLETMQWLAQAFANLGMACVYAKEFVERLQLAIPQAPYDRSTLPATDNEPTKEVSSSRFGELTSSRLGASGNSKDFHNEKRCFSLFCLELTSNRNDFLRRDKFDGRANGASAYPSLVSKRPDAGVTGPGRYPHVAIPATDLKVLIAILKNLLRPSDLIGLKSPTHWLILLHAMPFRMAKIVAERLGDAIQRHTWNISPILTIASYPEDGETAEELLHILELGIISLQPGMKRKT